MPRYNRPNLPPMEELTLGSDIQFIREVMYGKTRLTKGRKAHVVAVHTAYNGRVMRVRLAFSRRLYNKDGKRMSYHWCGFEHTKEFNVNIILDNCREV